MPFTFTKLAIPEVILIEPQVFGDDRGFFIETFKDSEAFITHLNNVGPMFPKLLESCTVTRAKIFGKPSDALKELLAPLGVEYFSHFNGISR